jgi:zinc protease
MKIYYLKRVFALLCLICFASLGTVHAYAQSAPAPLPGAPAPSPLPKDAVWPWEGSDLKNDPSVIYGRLPNGMRYAIKPNKLPEGAVVLRFRLKAGSKYERDDQRGLSHVIEHMVFNGSTNIPEGELTKTMERLGSSFGSDVNAHVSTDEAMYKLDLPRADGGRLETALKIFRETADRLLLDDAAIKREIGVVLSEMNDGDTPYRRVSRRTSAFMRPDDLSTKREPIGERAIIEGATSAKLREFYDRWYRPDRAILVIAGDVDVEATKALITTTFADWRPKTPAIPPEPDNGTWPKAELRALIQVEPDLPTVLSVTAVRPDEFDYGEMDTVAGHKWWLVHGIATEIFQRRLATMQLVDSPPASGVNFSQSRNRNGWTSTLTIIPRDQDWPRALRATVTELRQAMDTGFNTSEIGEAIKEFRLGYDRAIAEQSTRRTTAYAGSVMSSLSSDSVYLTPEDRKRLFEEVAAGVTPETLKAAFAWWWRGVDPALVLMSKTGIDGGEEALKTAWRDAMAAPVPARTPYVRAQYQPANIGAPGQVVSTRVRRDPDATIGRFANGVTLAFKQTNFTADRVSISVNYGAGSLAFPQDDPYWPTFASSAWNGDGVGALTRDQMITALAGRSTSLASVGVSHFTTSLGASPAKADLLEQLQIMISQVRESRLGPRAATLMRDQLKAGWDSIPLTASGVFGFNSGTFYYTGLTDFEVPDLQRFLDSDDARGKERLKAILANAPITVTIVGDTTWEAARDAVAQTFGALPPRTGLAPGFERLKAWTDLPAGGPPRVLRHKGTQNQAIAHVSWATPGSRNVQASNDFYVLAQVLQLRLTAKVREAAGESYSPDGSWNTEILVDKGQLTAFASVTPEHVATVDKMFDEIARDLGTTGPTADEIQRVVDPLLESRARSRQSNGFWVGLMSMIGLPLPPGGQRGDPLVLQKSVERRVRSITPEKLRRLAARYMVPANAIRVQVLPTPPEATVPPTAPVPPTVPAPPIG